MKPKKPKDIVEIDEMTGEAAEALLACIGDVELARMEWDTAFKLAAQPSNWTLDPTSDEKAAELRKKFHIVKTDPREQQ